MPNPVLSSLTLPVKNASTGVVTNVTYDLPAGGSGGGSIQSNPNLLDNPFFTVNQRGITTVSSYGYIVDRFMLQKDDTATVTASANGLVLTTKMNEGIKQFYSGALEDGTYTISAIVDGNILSTTFEVSNGAATEVPIKYSGDDTSWSAVILDSTTGHSIIYPYITYSTDTAVSDVTVKAVKLEKGSVCTLSMDSVPNYAIELAKCRASTADSTDTYANKGDILFPTVPRVTENANTLPGVNKWTLKEYSDSSANIPYAAWWYILTTQGSDPNWAVQIAWGETANTVYRRTYGSGSWGSWEAIKGKELTANAAKNATSVSFTDALITANGSYDVYSTIYTNITGMSISGTTLTVTFQALSSARTFKLRIS